VLQVACLFIEKIIKRQKVNRHWCFYAPMPKHYLKAGCHGKDLGRKGRILETPFIQMKIGAMPPRPIALAVWTILLRA